MAQCLMFRYFDNIMEYIEKDFMEESLDCRLLKAMFSKLLKIYYQ